MSRTLLITLISFYWLCPVLCDGPGSPYKYYPDPLNCSGFYLCDAEGNPNLFYCPGGLHFNPVLNTCDWPENINCSVDSFEDDEVSYGGKDKSIATSEKSSGKSYSSGDVPLSAYNKRNMNTKTDASFPMCRLSDTNEECKDTIYHSQSELFSDKQSGQNEEGTTSTKGHSVVSSGPWRPNSAKDDSAAGANNETESSQDRKKRKTEHTFKVEEKEKADTQARTSHSPVVNMKAFLMNHETKQEDHIENNTPAYVLNAKNSENRREESDTTNLEEHYVDVSSKHSGTGDSSKHPTFYFFLGNDTESGLHEILGLPDVLKVGAKHGNTNSTTLGNVTASTNTENPEIRVEHSGHNTGGKSVKTE